MSNATELLFKEKKRLERNNDYVYEHFREVSKPAMIEIERDGQKIPYIDFDRFTPEQRAKFDYVSRRLDYSSSKLRIFEQYIREMTPQSVRDSYGRMGVILYDEPNIFCDTMSLKVGDESQKYFISVCSNWVEVPHKIMTFDEYKKIYTSSLSELLIRSLGTGISKEEAMTQLQDAYTEVFCYGKQKPHTR